MSSFAHGVAMVCCILLVYYGVNKWVFDIDKATGVPIAAKMDDVFKFITDITSSKPETKPGMSVQDLAMGIMPSTQSNVVPSNAPMQALVSAPMAAPNVKYIQLLQAANTNLTINLAEVKVYDQNNELLKPSDFVGAKTDPPGGWGNDDYPAGNAIDGNDDNFSHNTYDSREKTLLITLAKNQFIKKVIVINRKDCCQDRLSGVLLSLFDSNMTLINSCKLTGDASTTCEW